MREPRVSELPACPFLLVGGGIASRPSPKR